MESAPKIMFSPPPQMWPWSVSVGAGGKSRPRSVGLATFVKSTPNRSPNCSKMKPENGL